MRSEIAANLNVFEFVEIFGEIFKTLGMRWSNRYGVTAPYKMHKCVPKFQRSRSRTSKVGLEPYTQGIS